MSKRIEDYALIGDCHAAALVATDGSIDWLCLPRFDSGACFAALLGDEHHGRWCIAPVAPAATTRAYRRDSLVLETVFETAEGSVSLVDFMPPRTDENVSHVIRIVEGRSGRVAMRSTIAVRFDYGSVVPWVTPLDAGSGVQFQAGPDRAVLRTTAALEELDGEVQAHFDLEPGERVAFVFAHGPSHRPLPGRVAVWRSLASTMAFWRKTQSVDVDAGQWTPLVRRSLAVLRALTYDPTGGIIAAPTTSLPESIGGSRNWDYRYCWLRDSALTLVALMEAGHGEEARKWRNWAQRVLGGDPSSLRIMYGLAGERRLSEWEVAWLPGYEESRPVRIGNAASDQLQLDVFGQLMGVVHFARAGGLGAGRDAWPFECRLLAHLETVWRKPDCGIWEFRDTPRHFTFSKLMVWLAFDCGVKAIEDHGMEGPSAHWRSLRDEVHAEICEKAWNAECGAFTQSYGASTLDASVLMMTRIGFLPLDDPRVTGTVAAIERDLCVDGLVLRYRTDQAGDGLDGDEGCFLACSFWLVDALAAIGRRDDALRLFERLVGLCNDVGLLAEEYDTKTKRQLGNFPQAFSHVSLINSALGLHRGFDPVKPLAGHERGHPGTSSQVQRQEDG